MPVDRDRFISKGAAATYTQGLSDAFDLKLVGAYREGDGRQFIDFEELNANLFQVPAEYSDNQASGEAQLTYTSDKLKGVTGVYYFDGTARGAFDASLGANNLTALTKGSVDTQSIAVYADATWSLTDKLNLNVGARWNQDEKEATVFVQQYLGRLPANATLFDQNNVPPGFAPLGRPQTNYTNDRTFSDVLPRFGFDYRLSDDVLGYVSYSKGFKSGGFDMRGNETANPATRDGYDSEIADNYEIGLKSMLVRRYAAAQSHGVLHAVRGRADHDAAVPEHQRRPDQRHGGAQRRQAAQQGRRAGIGVAAGAGADAWC